MKRIFALALVLIMALSMMAVTAFAVAPHSSAPGACNQTYYAPSYDYFICLHGSTTYQLHVNDIIRAGCMAISSSGATVYLDGVQVTNYTTLVQDAMVTSVDNLTRVMELSTYSAPAQPKTGVMDTLPVWFGVMAVSACAYVLTSKKKVF